MIDIMAKSFSSGIFLMMEPYKISIQTHKHDIKEHINIKLYKELQNVTY